MTQDSCERWMAYLRSELKALAQSTLDGIGTDRNLDLLIFYAPPCDLIDGRVDRTILSPIQDVTVGSLAKHFEEFALHQQGRVPYGFIALIDQDPGCITAASLMNSPFFSEPVYKKLESYILSQYSIMTGAS